MTAINGELWPPNLYRKCAVEASWFVKRHNWNENKKGIFAQCSLKQRHLRLLAQEQWPAPGSRPSPPNRPRGHACLSL